jgi:hypothetical protein
VSVAERGFRRPFRLRLDGWTALSLFIALVIASPLLAVGWMALFPTENIWGHLGRPCCRGTSATASR